MMGIKGDFLFSTRYILSNLFLSFSLCTALNLAAQSQTAHIGLYEDAIERYSQGNWSEAMIQLQNALQENPNHLPSRILLGNIHLQSGRGAAAEKELTLAMELGGAKDQIYLPLGNAYLVQRKYQQILDNIDITTAQFRNRVDLLTLHGRAYFELARLREAEQIFTRAMQLNSRAIGPLLGQANLLMAQGKLQPAEELIDKAKDLAPNHAESWYEKGKIRAARNDAQGALVALNRALDLAGGHMPARLARTALYLRLNELDKAAEDALFVRKAQPLDPEAALLYSQALMKQGKKEEAQDQLEAAVDILNRIKPEFMMKQPGLLKTAAIIQFMSGNVQQADVYITQYIAYKPLDKGMRMLLGQIKLHLKEYEEAIRVLYPVYQVQRNDPEVLYLLGEAMLQTGRYAEASNILEEAARLEPSAAAIGTRLALGQLGLGQTEDAVAVLQKVFDSGSAGSSSAGIILTTLKIKLGKHKEALATASTLAARQPNNPLVKNLIGAVYLAMQEPGPARNAFESALAIKSDFLPASYNLAMIDTELGNSFAAKDRYQAILKQYPEATQAMLGLSQIAIAEKDSKSAITWLLKATSAEPDAVRPRAQLIELYAVTGDLEKAFREAEGLSERHPENAEALEIYARMQVATGLKKEAELTYQNAVKYAGFTGGALLRIARDQIKLADYSGANLTLQKAAQTEFADRANAMLVRMKIKIDQAEDARTNAEKVLAHSPKSALGYNLLGEIAASQNNLADALAHFQKGFDQKNNTESLIGLYQTYSRMGEADKALKVMNAWMEDHPDDRFIRRNLAIGYLRAGKQESAQKEFEQLVADGEQGAVVMSSLARIYQLQKDSRARDFGRRALQINPGWPVALDTYGWILVTEGEAEQGLKYLREAVSRDSNPLIRYHLAVALAELGRTGEARIELQTVLQSNSKQPWIESAKKLYESLGA